MKIQVKKIMRSTSFHDQTGGTRVYALLALTVVFLLGHAAYNYLPVIYQAENFKGEMQSCAVRVLAMPHGNEPLADKLKKQIRIAGNDNGVPPNALIEVTEAKGSLQARVRFTREVNLLPFGLYKYNYLFDSSASA